MSKIALEEFKGARDHQVTQNEARRIRTRVQEAQQNSARAGVRWPFELIQNAHDAGPRDGSCHVEINFILQEDNLVVSHTGKPFNPQELAALLSGGSSKEFDDEETTGRFGTGFLVTHALSTRVNVDALLKTREGTERFRIELDRDGGENSIVENIESANQSLQNAETIRDSPSSGIPTATFTYYFVNADVANTGLNRLRDALPYLYATCEKLGRVYIETLDETTTFEPDSTSEHQLDGLILQETEVTISDSLESRGLNAIRLSEEEGRSALLVVLEGEAPQRKLRLLDPEFPKLFVKFPIAGTGFLPFNFLLDGSFTPQQERDGILMNPEDKKLIVSAMSSLPSLARHAVQEGWTDAHQLACLSVPERTFSDEAASGESEWWHGVVTEVATSVAKQPIVETASDLLPALHGDGDETASFLVASMDVGKVTSFEYEEIHSLAIDIAGLHIPDERVAQDWGEIARVWHESGVDVKRIGIQELIDTVIAQANSIDDLPVLGDAFDWLSRLLQLIKESLEEYTVSGLIDGILPDQNGALRNSSDLRVDRGVSEEIKDIARDVGIDLRSKLVNKELWQALSRPGFEAAQQLVVELCGNTYEEPDARDEILGALANRLPDDHKFTAPDVAPVPLLRAAARMVPYLSNREDTQGLRRCPLLTASDTIVYLTGSQQILAPKSAWPESARSYADLYTENRILSDLYCEDGDLKPALDALVSVGLAIPAPLYEAVRNEISDQNLLSAMSVDGTDVANVTVRNEIFGQIAFLSTDLVQRCGNDPPLAKRLLKFVLNVAAVEDQGWRVPKNIIGTRGGESVTLSVRGSIWPYELKVRAWVPVPFPEDSEEEGFVSYPATENYLRELDEDSLSGNNADARELLHQVFGFKRLELMLAGLDENVKSELEELLEDHRLVGSAVRHRDLLKTAEEKPEVAQLISEVGTEEIEEIREELNERQRKSAIRETNRSFGHAAQAALANAIEEYGLDLELVDRGFDYEVFAGDLEEAPFRFTVGSYFLEVKATTTGDVRLTPLQAETSAEYPDRFVLCVIDLRQQELKSTWDRSDVEPYAKIVTGIGGKVEEVYDYVNMLTSNDELVRLRNEEQLRYGLSSELWENGISIGEWVRSLTPTLQPHTAP